MLHIKAVRDLGQSIWLDYIDRNLIITSELKKLVNDGLLGMTTNPAIFQKAIAQGDDYDDTLRSIVRFNPNADTKTLYERLTIEDIQMACDIFRPVYDSTDGIDGLVSLEVSPHFAYDTDGTIADARRLWQLVKRPNAMIKVPSTPEGIPAIETLIAEGINVNVTLIFSLKQYEAISQAYIRGVARNPNPQRVASVASFFVSRIDSYVDRELEKIGTQEALALRGKAAVATAKLAYRRFRKTFFQEAFTAQRQRGARIQRLLWGSTSTKNPDYSDILYVQELIGPDTVNTVPLETLNAFRHHGQARLTIEQGIEEAEHVLASLAKLGVNLDAVTERLQRDGVKAFASSFDQLLTTLEDKRRQVLGAKG